MIFIKQKGHTGGIMFTMPSIPTYMVVYDFLSVFSIMINIHLKTQLHSCTNS